MAQRGFSTKQVSEMTGLTVRQLTHWAQYGTFTPAVQQPDGPGTRSLYSYDDIVQLRSLRLLQCRRWSIQKLEKAIIMLREVMRDPHPLRQATLIGDRHTLLAIYKTKEGERVMLDGQRMGGQQVLSLVLETVEVETQQRIVQFVGQDNDNE
jgi:DNA-binding transcriptional MerR regulator